MKTVTFTQFRKNASELFTEVEQGETLIVLRYGKPVAQIIPFSKEEKGDPSWKKPGIRLQIDGAHLSSAILEERKGVQ